MKALTICQPFAELIIRGLKPVENRQWRTDYRGPLLIHAGKSREWLSRSLVANQLAYGIPEDELDFGGIIGVVEVAYCHPISYLRSDHCDNALRHLAYHEHTHGPFCFILKNQRRFSSPIPCRGMMGLFDVPELTRRCVETELAKLNSTEAQQCQPAM